jgi:hypothetical protein
MDIKIKLEKGSTLTTADESRRLAGGWSSESPP